MAVGTQKARKNNGVAQEAALLTSTVCRPILRPIQASEIRSKGLLGERTERRRNEIDDIVEKENVESVGIVPVVRNLESEFSHSIDDIPIGMWRERDFSAEPGGPRTLPEKGELSAADSLLGLSRMR